MSPSGDLQTHATALHTSLPCLATPQGCAEQVSQKEILGAGPGHDTHAAANTASHLFRQDAFGRTSPQEWNAQR